MAITVTVLENRNPCDKTRVQHGSFIWQEASAPILILEDVTRHVELFTADVITA
jgi:formate dehydrogenase assembly factor FdhD